LISSLKKFGAIILAWMMAPKLTGEAGLGRHPLYVSPGTMTGVIRTTAMFAMLCRKAAETGRAFGMATITIFSRHEDNRMGAGESISQINSFVLRNKL
jgi:hypothetical protein